MSRLFHTLVVYGATAALSGCSSGEDEAAEGALDDAGAGGSGDAGTGASSGASSGGTAGAPVAFGGANAGGSGGSGGSAGGGDAGVVKNPSLSTYARWSCEDLICGGDAFLLDGPCPEDPNRPSRPSDCAPDEWFQCLRATLGSATILVNCSCEPMATLDGCFQCATNADYGTRAECNGAVSVCSCFTGILR